MYNCKNLCVKSAVMKSLYNFSVSLILLDLRYVCR